MLTNLFNLSTNAQCLFIINVGNSCAAYLNYFYFFEPIRNAKSNAKTI